MVWIDSTSFSGFAFYGFLRSLGVELIELASVLPRAPRNLYKLLA